MGYEIALKNSWNTLIDLLKKRQQSTKEFVVIFLGEKYWVKPNLELVCNGREVAKQWLSLLIIHYLLRKIAGLPKITGQWISFRELPGGDSYYPAFRRRVLLSLIDKFGHNPLDLYNCLKHLPGEKVKQADAAIRLEVFPEVPVLIEIWGEDEELPAEVNMLFDQNISQVFCTEDIAVLAGFIAQKI
ncbi:MAG: DUF3786 domain-containing protein [Candidatus Omnitrophica bacterium]|nr:DUF3786 domain-containing protein [Candidatus Omnitrophota bacterium]